MVTENLKEKKAFVREVSSDDRNPYARAETESGISFTFSIGQGRKTEVWNGDTAPIVGEVVYYETLIQHEKGLRSMKVKRIVVEK